MIKRNNNNKLAIKKNEENHRYSYSEVNDPWEELYQEKESFIDIPISPLSSIKLNDLKDSNTCTKESLFSFLWKKASNTNDFIDNVSISSEPVHKISPNNEKKSLLPKLKTADSTIISSWQKKKYNNNLNNLSNHISWIEKDGYKDNHKETNVSDYDNRYNNNNNNRDRVNENLIYLTNPTSLNKYKKYRYSYHSRYIQSPRNNCEKLIESFESPLLLLCIGTFASLLSILVNYCIVKEISFRHYIGEYHYLFKILFSLISAWFSTFIVQLICPQATGSGLPEMKVVISGIVLPKYLSISCLVAKIIGLLSAFGAGLSIGKEGPFIMITCAFADNLMRLSIFERIREDSAKRLEILACACAAGVAATFGTPFGGVLFSVEVTSTFYMVRNLPRSFFASITGAIIIIFIGKNGDENSLFHLSLSDLGITEGTIERVINHVDIVIFMMVGVICGLFGALFTYCISKLVEIREKLLSNAFDSQDTNDSVIKSSLYNEKKLFQDYKMSLYSPEFIHLIKKKIILVSIVTLFVSLCEILGNKLWYVNQLHDKPRRLIDSLFKRSHFEHAHGPVVSSFSNFCQLLYVFPLQYVITMFCVVLPLPAGIFAPSFLIGGILGRLLGEAFAFYIPTMTKYHPFEFALIGAGAFSSGVTRAVSTAIIIMELCHDDHLIIPISIAILSAYYTGAQLNENVYDVLITTNRLPRLKKLPKEAFDIPAWEVMKPVKQMYFLTIHSTYSEAKKIISECLTPVFPIVDNNKNMFLIGTVQRNRLKKAIKYCEQRQKMGRSDTSHTNKKNNLSKWNDIDICVKTPQVNCNKIKKRNIFRSVSADEYLNNINHLSIQSENNVCMENDEMKSNASNNDDTNSNNIKVYLMNWPIRFALQQGNNLMNWETNEIIEKNKFTVAINPAPFQIMEATGMQKVDIIFRMLKLNNVYVTRCGKLVGVISRDRLMSFLETIKFNKQDNMFVTLYKSICKRV